MSGEFKSDRSMAGLRELLFDQIDRLRNGQSDVSEAKAIANLAREIVASVNMQMEYEKLKLDSAIPANLPELKLVPPLKVVANGEKP